MPRIWHGKQTDGNGKDQPTIGKPIALEDDDERSLEELAKALSMSNMIYRLNKIRSYLKFKGAITIYCGQFNFIGNIRLLQFASNDNEAKP